MAHSHVTRQLWARHGFLEEVPDASFLAKGRMACRIYEEELMQDSPGRGAAGKLIAKTLQAHLLPKIHKEAQRP